jgi:cyclic pyranopterin phosphate synthase
MKEQLKEHPCGERTIDYLRISVTDRCNLHCMYCMPEKAPYIPHEEILRYEEILQIAEAGAAEGIRLSFEVHII